MRKTLLFTSLLFALFSTCALGVGGNMGGTDPNGSPEKPYLIEDIDDFDEFANNPTYWAAGVHTKLTIDIDLTGRTYPAAVIAPDASTISFFQGTKFAGVFDGNYHCLTNLYVTSSYRDYIGLFGYVESGQIKNLCLENAVLHGNHYVGGLCARNSGSITNCYTNGNITGGNSVGILCGGSAGSITNCYTTGSVSGASNYIGGLCGFNDGVVTSSFSIGTVNADNRAGGLCGWSNAESVINCYFYSYGGPDNGLGIALDDLQLLDKANYIGLDFSDNSEDGLGDYWSIVEGFCPKLVWQTDNGPVAPFALDSIATMLTGTGYENDPFLINDYNDLMEFRNNPTLRIGRYRLTNNVDLTGQIYSQAFIWESFNGCLDGNGYSIRRLSIDGESTLRSGFFKTLYGEITDLGLEDIEINGESSIAGGLCAYSFSGKIVNCYSTGTVSGDDIIGGLCGSNEDNSVIQNSYSIITISGNTKVGGMCGRNDGSILNSYANGIVNGSDFVGGFCGIIESGSSIADSYSTGTVSGNTNIGGFCGHSNNGNINNSFWDVETSKIGSIGDANFGAIGKTTTAMQSQSTFSGWDFVNDWMMLRPGEDYPRLAWQEVFAGDIAGLYGADMVDFAEIARNWQNTGCPGNCEDADIDGSGDVGLGCEDADIDGSGDVGLGDLAAVAADWLQ
jgi:hypothetical protein